jgi:Flp pilus assembly protein CpaB
MRTPARGYSARRKWLGLSPAAIAAIVVVMAIGGLWIGGVIDPIRLFRGSGEPSHRGQVAIPVSAMVIPAYTRITRDHLWNPTTHNFAVIYLRPEQITPEIKRTQSSVIGRVMDHDKPPTYVFTEADFLPPGTKPGLVAGIPSGKRAMRVPAEKITGLIGLLPGDRFDLLSTLPIDGGGAASGGMGGGLYARQLELQARLTNWQKQATVRVVVQNGNIVQPMTTRQVPVSNPSLTQGIIVRTKPVQEVVIAVFPSEVAHLTEALAVGAEVTCIPRSGRPDDPYDSITPESNPWSPYGGVVQRPSAVSSDGSSPTVTSPGMFGAGFTPVETISGNKREIIAAPVKK